MVVELAGRKERKVKVLGGTRDSSTTEMPFGAGRSPFIPKSNQFQVNAESEASRDRLSDLVERRERK